ncbi:GRB2-associated-binding protein 4-like [Perognathus longimembris pacificus]|uniref:GRB2-associated-binding protein 4-like n=1 Tax=Perognathus longimembris pacificus TaxID=214514 RepID=UPI002019E61A|nr:GRB2-associated-binding protein 4-like [Perognathus longimembris pacificus]
MDGGHIVLSGWLKKSPREKKFGLRIWRKRWFVLRGGQRRSREGVLEYYENSCSKKPRGSIDLSLCEALNSGVTFQSTRQPKGFVFGIETRERTFYLLARSEDDMHKWVESICQICGLGPVEENTGNKGGCNLSRWRQSCRPRQAAEPSSSPRGSR